MKIRFTLRRPSANPVNFQITADATATVGDVAAALTSAAPGEPGPAVDPRSVTLRVQDPRLRTKVTTLDPEVSLPESGLRSGSEIEVAPATSADAQVEGQAAVLRFVAGPQAGREVDLPFGGTDIGRASICSVRVRDPLVSKRHVRVLVGDGIEVMDLNSANGVLVGGQRINRLRVGPDDVITIGNSAFTVIQTRRPTGEMTTSTDIEHVRPPRILPRVPDAEIELPATPRPKEASRFPILAMAAPVVLALVFFLVMRNAMSIMFMAMSPLLMIGSYLDQRAQNNTKYREGVAAFEEALQIADADLRAAHDHERACRLALHTSVDEVVADTVGLGSLLWSRRPEHDEFLTLRIGLGTIIPTTKIKQPSPNDSPKQFVQRSRELAASYAFMPGVPVTVNLRLDGSLGISGNRDLLDPVARALVTQLVCLHSPAEVVLTCLTSAQGQRRWQWLEWLPHTNSPHTPLGPLHVASDAATGAVLLSHLDDLLDKRLAGKKAQFRGPIDDKEKSPTPLPPEIVILVDGAQVEHGRINRIVEAGPDVGIHVIWVSEHRSEVPAGCRSYVELRSDGARVNKVRFAQSIPGVGVEGVSKEVADEIGRVLAPVVDSGFLAQDSSDLPRSVSLVSLIGHELADNAETVLQRWQENDSIIDRTQVAPLRRDVVLRALVGHAGSEPFTLDLRSQGPHALVGGTTGAGKSEFLQAWVLGMAQAHSPDRVTFLFVDYKGGSAFARCTELPHCVGLVTDLSTHLVRRALTSLRAEIHRREVLLNKKGAKDLVTLEKMGDPECPPSLIIIVDEFAALVGEVPEFVDGVIDVAQRGRSLGLHLVLATQRPAGVINDSLRANTNLRVALRMNDEHDSQDVLGEKTAAHFDPSIPGRGAAKTGPGRVTQFQSAYPGARTFQEVQAARIDVEELTFGMPARWRVPEPPRPSEDVEQDIDRVVATLRSAAQLGELPEPRKPWLPGLANAYDLQRLRQRRDSELVLGVIDDPKHQAQHVEYFYPDVEGHIAFYGAGGSGKSTALRSLAIAAAITPRSGGVDVYALDFAGGSLGMLEPLPHVGAVISGDDDERVARLIRWLSAVVEERAVRYSAARAATLSDYRRISGSNAERRILVLIDGMGTMRAEYEKTLQRQALFEQFERLLVDGRAVGLHFAAGVERVNAMPLSMATTFQRKVVLRQTDESGYLDFSLPKDVLSPKSPAGRAMQVEKPQELQLAIFGDNINTLAQAKKIEDFAEYLRKTGVPEPFRIRRLPTEVRAADMPLTVGGLPTLGVEDRSLEPMAMVESGAVLVGGPAQSGVTNAFLWMALAQKAYDPALRILHLSARKSPLAGLDLWEKSLQGPEAWEEEVFELQSLFEQAASYGHRVALFVEDYPEFLDSVADMSLGEVVKIARRNEHLVVAAGDTGLWGSSWPLISEIRNARTGLLLQPEDDDGDMILRTALPRVKRSNLPVGRGFWIQNAVGYRVQIPLVEL